MKHWVKSFTFGFGTVLSSFGVGALCAGGFNHTAAVFCGLGILRLVVCAVWGGRLGG